MKVVNLPGLPPKGDVSDYLATHTKADLVALAKAAPVYTPAAVSDTTVKHGTEQRFPRTDAGNAEYLAQHQRGRWVFDYAAQVWRQWSGHTWAVDRTNAIYAEAKAMLRTRAAAALTMSNDEERRGELAWAVASESRRGLDALECGSPSRAKSASGSGADPAMQGSS